MNTILTKAESRLLKKTIAQIYNKINQEFYATGVVSKRIQIFDDRIIIFAQQKSVVVFHVLIKNYKELSM